MKLLFIFFVSHVTKARIRSQFFSILTHSSATIYVNLIDL